MKTDDFYPSRWLRCADLKNKPVTVTIDRVETATFQNDGDAQSKPVIYFRGTDKALVVNKTNFFAIQDALAEDETDKWPGKKICLYPTMVDFKGTRTAAIRIRPAEQAAKTQPKLATEQAGGGAAFDDSIPFAPEWR
jgi:hypothetical protein